MNTSLYNKKTSTSNNNNNSNNNNSNNNTNTSTNGVARLAVVQQPPSREAAVLQRAVVLAESAKYDAALAQLRDHLHQPEFRNVQGVCLMRMGRSEQAIRVFRGLVLEPGCTWMKPLAPLAYKINFATALLLGGLPAGCMETLSEMRAEHDPRVIRLRGAIKSWEDRLSCWQRLNWRFGRIAPANRPIALDYPAGDLGMTEVAG